MVGLSAVGELKNGQGKLKESLSLQKIRHATSLAEQDARDEDLEEKKKLLTESREEAVKEKAKNSILREEVLQVCLFLQLLFSLSSEPCFDLPS